jgi:hypothetical protein
MLSQEATDILARFSSNNSSEDIDWETVIASSGLRSFRLLDSVLVLQTVKGDRCDWVLRTFDVDKPQGPVQKREDGLF